MIRRHTLAAVIAGLFLLAGLPSVEASDASAITLAFVTYGRAANALLLESGRLAEANAGSTRIQAFARGEAATRAEAADAFVAWVAADRHAAEAETAAPSLDMLGRLFGPTDRAIGVVITPAPGEPVVPRLAATSGRDFDALFVTAQADALRRIVTLDVDYIKNGDDPALRALAVRDLPQARRLLAEVTRL